MSIISKAAAVSLITALGAGAAAADDNIIDITSAEGFHGELRDSFTAQSAKINDLSSINGRTGTFPNPDGTSFEAVVSITCHDATTLVQFSEVNAETAPQTIQFELNRPCIREESPFGLARPAG